MQESYLNSPLMYSIALTLIHFIWQGGLVALALKIALVIVPRQNALLRYSFSAVAMVMNLLLPIITFFIIYKPTYLQLTHSLSNTPVSGINLADLASSQNEWYLTTFEYLPYITVFWLSVIGILSLKLIIELYSVNQLPNKGTIAPEQELMNRFVGLVEQIGLTHTPKLLLSISTEVPMAIGWLKPVVLIPVSMLSGLTPAQLDMLILHELAHIRRHDYLVNFIQTLVEIVLFFHPAVLWVSNQMRNEREYCSDDIAVHHCGNPIAYAHTLADTASICNKHRKHSIPSMAMAASGGDLTQRVIRLVNETHCSSQNNVSKWFASLFTLCIVLFISSQQLLKLTEVELNTNQYTFNDKSDVSLKSKALPSSVPSMATQPNRTQTNTIKVPVPSNKELVSERIISTAPSLAQIDPTGIEKVQPNSVNKHNVVSKQKPSFVAIKVNRKPILDVQINNIPEHKALNSTEVPQEHLLLNEPKRQSIVERAFEKTDSRLTTATNKNKYANEITTLSSDLTIKNRARSFDNFTELLPQSSAVNALEESRLPIESNAKLVYSTAPKYPSTAKRKGIELEVKVDFIIDQQGRVRDIKFHPKNKINYFRSSVRSAIEKWKFEPAKYNGKAIESKMTKIFLFSLKH